MQNQSMGENSPPHIRKVTIPKIQKKKNKKALKIVLKNNT